MTTPADLAALCLLDAGIIGQGQTASGEDTNNWVRRANMLLAQWNRKRWLVYHLIETVIESTGAISYTIGPGQDFNVARPDRLEDGNFFRQFPNTGVNPIDYPLRLLQSREDYNRIALKNMGTWPDTIFYDSGYPDGLVYIWPVPQASLYEIHILTKAVLSAFTDLTADINMPPEYEQAIYANMVVRLRAAYQLPPDPVFVALAKESLNVLRGANAQIPTMRLPNAVINRRWAYNVFSDGY